MFSLMRKSKMIKELKENNVVMGKYMYTDVLDIISNDENFVYTHRDYVQQLIEKSIYSEALSIQDGEYLIPLFNTYMVTTGVKYRSNFKENEDVLGFASEIDFESLDRRDIAYFYEIYQNYRNKENKQSKTYQLKR